jgi:hypothetical protein
VIIENNKLIRTGASFSSKYGTDSHGENPNSEHHNQHQYQRETLSPISVKNYKLPMDKVNHPLVALNDLESNSRPSSPHTPTTCIPLEPPLLPKLHLRKKIATAKNKQRQALQHEQTNKQHLATQHVLMETHQILGANRQMKSKARLRILHDIVLAHWLENQHRVEYAAECLGFDVQPSKKVSRLPGLSPSSMGGDGDGNKRVSSRHSLSNGAVNGLAPSGIVHVIPTIEPIKMQPPGFLEIRMASEGGGGSGVMDSKQNNNEESQADGGPNRGATEETGGIEFNAGDDNQNGNTVSAKSGPMDSHGIHGAVHEFVNIKIPTNHDPNDTDPTNIVNDNTHSNTLATVESTPPFDVPQEVNSNWTYVEVANVSSWLDDSQRGKVKTPFVVSMGGERGENGYTPEDHFPESPEEL